MSEVFAVCNSHQNLTSKTQEIDLSSETRLLIAEIRQNEIIRAQKKLHEKVEQNLSVLINGNKNSSDTDPDVRSIITENILLRQLNSELKCKSDLLLNTIELMKTKKPTYAETTKNRFTKQVRIPNINVVNKSESLSNECAINNINMVLQKDIIVPIKGIINTKNSGTIVKCANGEDVQKACDLLKQKLGEDFKVRMQQPYKPRLKILGIPTDFDIDELESDINIRNFGQLNNKCQVLQTFICANKKQGAIIEIQSDLYEHVANNRYKIYIGHQCFKVYDAINISLCSKCARFNHNEKKCTNAAKCIFCAENHLAKDCKKNDHKCANCSYANEKFGEKYNTEHMASDAKAYEILKKKIAVYISNTEYPVQPMTPNFIGPRSPSRMSNSNDNNEIQNKPSTVDNAASDNQTQVLTPKLPRSTTTTTTTTTTMKRQASKQNTSTQRSQR